jgi:hypothetical protein
MGWSPNKTLMGAFLSALAFSAGAIENHCRNGGADLSSQPSMGERPCGGRPLPEDRKRLWRNLRLECTSASSQFLRGPVPFNFKEWAKLEDIANGATGERKIEARRKMQEYRQQNEALIQWKGSIPYQTMEEWEWTSCDLGFHNSCTPKRVRKTREVPVYNEKGEQTGTRSEEYIEEIPQECYDDVGHSESRFCSSEVMDYEASYHRPTLKEWGPQVPGYYDIIPNKYDLLPGEDETPVIVNNRSKSTGLNPDTSVQNAWNKYDPKEEFLSGTPSCVMNNPTKIRVTIYTVARDTTKASPNAFRLPTKREAVETRKSSGEKGMVPTKVDALVLEDSSFQIFDSMQRQVEAFGTMNKELEKARAASGNASNTTAEELAKGKEEGGFWRQTHVRIRLMEDLWARNRFPTQNVELNRLGNAVGGIFNITVSDSNEEQNVYVKSGPLGQWSNFVVNGIRKVPLLGAYASYEMRPGRRYFYKVAMYQEGIPFYKQAKDAYFGSHWSKDLEIEFKPSKEVDLRNLWDRFSMRTADLW